MSDPSGVLLSKKYRKARNLFLTQQFAEAFSEIGLTLEPGEWFEGDVHDGEGKSLSRVPILFAKKSVRVKIWSLYLTLLNTFRKAGNDQAGVWVGARRWKGLYASLCDGSIWQNVLHVGYADNEHAMDHEITVALTTLCLEEPRSSIIAQERLETLLAEECTTISQNPSNKALIRYNQLVELFVLHILPRNLEWAYARAFVSANSHIDLDSKVRYQEALNALEDSTRNAEQEIREPWVKSIEKARDDDGSNLSQRVQSQAHDQSPQKAAEISGPMKPKSPKPPSAISQPDFASYVRRTGVTVDSARTLEQSRSTKYEQHSIHSAATHDLVASESKKRVQIALPGVVALKTMIVGGSEYLLKNSHFILRVLLLYFIIRGLFASKRARTIITRWLDKVKRTAIMGTKVSYA